MPPPASTPQKAPTTPAQNLVGYYSEQRTTSTVPPQPADEWDFTVLKFGSECSLRGRLGKYLTAMPVNQTQLTQLGSGNLASTSPSQTSRVNALKASQGQGLIYLLGVEGQGIGEQLDCFTFVNVENRYVFFSSLLHVEMAAF
jgi:hypothetical protein